MSIDLHQCCPSSSSLLRRWLPFLAFFWLMRFINKRLICCSLHWNSLSKVKNGVWGKEIRFLLFKRSLAFSITVPLSLSISLLKARSMERISLFLVSAVCLGPRQKALICYSILSGRLPLLLNLENQLTLLLPKSTPLNSPSILNPKKLKLPLKRNHLVALYNTAASAP